MTIPIRGDEECINETSLGCAPEPGVPEDHRLFVGKPGLRSGNDVGRATAFQSINLVPNPKLSLLETLHLHLIEGGPFRHRCDRIVEVAMLRAKRLQPAAGLCVVSGFHHAFFSFRS